MLSLLACAAILAAQYRARYPLPSAVIPSGWGVNIHFTDPARGEMAGIARAFRWVRMDFTWSSIERTKGDYDFSAYDRLMSSLDAQRIRPIFILDYGNDLYQKGSPRSPEAREGFCNFVSAAVSHFRHRGIIWEMWNEPNIQFWSPKPNVDEYVALATKVGQTIRREARDEWFIGPATSTFDWKFLSACFKAGLLRYWDAVSVHPYRPSEPETVVTDWDRLRHMIAESAPIGTGVGMISGEWGYSDVWGDMNLGKQGDYIVRQYLADLLAGVDLSIWYDWKNDGPDPKEPEHHFGSAYTDRTPKPAYARALAFSGALRGYREIGRFWSGIDPADYVLLFGKRGRVAVVVWTTRDRHKIHVNEFLDEVEVTQTPQVIFVPRLPGRSGSRRDHGHANVAAR